MAIRCALIDFDTPIVNGASISGTINGVDVFGKVYAEDFNDIRTYIIPLLDGPIDDSSSDIIYMIEYDKYYKSYILYDRDDPTSTNDLVVVLRQEVAETAPAIIPSKYIDQSYVNDKIDNIRTIENIVDYNEASSGDIVCVSHLNNEGKVDKYYLQSNSYVTIASITIPEDPTTDTTTTWITDSDNNITGFTIDKDSDGNIFYLQKVYALFSGISANDGTSTKDLILKLNENTQDNFSLKGLVKNDRAEATLTIECLRGTDQVIITGAVMINAPWGGQATPYMMTPNSNMNGRNDLTASFITKLTFTSDTAIKPGGKIKIFGIKYRSNPNAIN